MNFAVVAYPRLDEGDRRRIESFRARHDPQASLVAAHFTLVFPFEGSPDALATEIAEAARSFEPFVFAIRSTAVVRDVSGARYHIFLVPDEGADGFRALHDRLYAGSLRPQLRPDIPFVPHMTVGAAGNAHTAEAWAEAFGVRSRHVPGAIATLDLLDVGSRPVRSIATHALGKAARP